LRDRIERRIARGGSQRPVAARGRRRPFPWVPLVATDGVILSLDRLQGVLEIDAANRIARVQAGTRLFALGARLAAAGFAMENLGDINVQSIAGAVSTGTHGTGIAFGNLATQVTAFKILTAAGEEITATPEGTPD